MACRSTQRARIIPNSNILTRVATLRGVVARYVVKFETRGTRVTRVHVRFAFADRSRTCKQTRGASAREEGKEDKRKKENEKGGERNGGRLGNNRRQKRGRRRSSRVKRERAVIFATKGESQSGSRCGAAQLSVRV